MGTRGALGFYRDGVGDKITYNHFDSYPDCLGRAVLKFITSTPIAMMNDIFDQIILVPADSKPTPEQVKECIKFHDSRVSTGSPEEWYALLRESQGDLNAYKFGLRYMIDNHKFMQDSLFCEWAYIINLTENTLEVYRGFNKRKNKQAKRYAVDKPDDMGYYAVKMLTNNPLSDYEEKWTQYWVADMEKEGGE